MRYLWLPFYLSALVFSTLGSDIGVNYGLLGNNLPHPKEVIAMLKHYQIGRVRIFEPNHDVLNALANNGVRVTIGVKNEELANIASNQGAADAWFANHIKPYANSINFDFITAGNEVIPGDLGRHVAPAMQNLYNAVTKSGLKIKVSTVAHGGCLQNTYPPSASVFKENAKAQMQDVIKFLSRTGSSLLANIYPYFAYSSDRKVQLDYAIFNAKSPVVTDGSFKYTYMLDAMIDSYYWAMEKEGVTNVPVVVSETGWPSAGNGQFTNANLASTYNRNFKNYILGSTGTPKRPNLRIYGYIFAMFNENQKPNGVEQNWGLFYPNKQPVYNIF